MLATLCLSCGRAGPGTLVQLRGNVALSGALREGCPTTQFNQGPQTSHLGPPAALRISSPSSWSRLGVVPPMGVVSGGVMIRLLLATQLL